MEITVMESFLSYYHKTREGTVKVIQAIPPDLIDWSYSPGKFTFGDLIRHIAAIERNLFAEIVQGKPMNYKGCGKELANGYDETLAYFNRMHNESVAIFSAIPNDKLDARIISASGKPSSIRSFLRALIIHEVHHRGALCIYLAIQGINPPPVYGLTAENLIEKSLANQ